MTITGLIIDSREPQHIKDLKFGGIPVSVMALEQGDVFAVCDDGCTICVERKQPDDFLNSLRDERLMVQLGKMAEKRFDNLIKVNPINNYWPYLVISGSMYPSADGHVITPRGVTGWQWSSVQGALATIQEMGIFVVFCNGDGDYEDCIIRIGNRKRKKDLMILPPRPANIMDNRSGFIAGLPGIGIERIMDTMAWAGNLPAHALIGLTDLAIDGPISKGFKVKIRQFMGLQDNENFEIVCNQVPESESAPVNLFQNV